MVIQNVSVTQEKIREEREAQRQVPVEYLKFNSQKRVAIPWKLALT